MPIKLKIESLSPGKGSVLFGNDDGVFEELPVASISLHMVANAPTVATVRFYAFEVDVLAKLVDLAGTEVLTPYCIHCQDKLVRENIGSEEDPFFVWTCGCSHSKETKWPNTQ